MELLKAKLIKTSSCDISYEDFIDKYLPLAKSVYYTGDLRVFWIFTGNVEIEIITDFESLDEGALDICKRRFNCLQPFDDALFFDMDGKFLCAVPYGLIELYEIKDEISRLGCDKANNAPFEDFILWLAVKNLSYADNIARREINNNVGINSEKAIKYAFAEGMGMTGKPKDEKEIILRRINLYLSGGFKEKKGAFAKTLGRLRDGRDDLKKAACAKIESRAAKKNLIVFHMETLSNEILMNSGHLCPNLLDLKGRSIGFSSFYTTASSSIMSLYDFFYGNDFEIGACSSYGKIRHENPINEHMYETLRRSGYRVAGVGFNDRPEGEEVNKQRLWNVKGQDYIWIKDFEDFLNYIVSFIKDGEKPFALHIWNLLTQSGHWNAETSGLATYAEKYELSYISLDETIRAVMRCLGDEGLLADTVIAAYGDHGDDMWTRDMNFGYTHVTPPYKNVIHTPCFIYDHDLKPYVHSEIAGMTDLKYTLLYMLGIDPEDDFPYSGVNLFKNRNRFVYSRSLIFNQKQIEKISAHSMRRLNNYDPHEIKNKAFAVISDSYHLLAGSDGLELYMNSMDPCGYNNVLNFICFDENFTPVRFDNKSAWRGHFRIIMMKDPQVYEILYNYNLLRNALIQRLRLKSEMISEQFPDAEKYFFDIGNLNKIRSRGFLGL